jgi:hypothetical protein
MDLQQNPVRALVQDYGWVHLGLGLIGNISFFIGSILFLPSLEPWKTLGVWLFILGAFLMMLGSLGRLLVDLWEEDAVPTPRRVRERAFDASS